MSTGLTNAQITPKRRRMAPLLRSGSGTPTRRPNTFGAAAKEKREREDRRHEQQVQYLRAQLRASRIEARELEARPRVRSLLKEHLSSQALIVEQLRASAIQQANRVDELRTRAEL